MVENPYPAARHETSFRQHVLGLLRNAGERIANFFATSADAASTDDIYEINIELPGLSNEDVSVELNDNALVKKGEKCSNEKKPGKLTIS